MLKTPSASLVSFARATTAPRLPVSVRVTQFFELGGALLHPPFVDRLNVETPIAADLETGQLALLEQTIDSGAMNPQVLREFAHGQNFGGLGCGFPKIISPKAQCCAILLFVVIPDATYGQLFPPEALDSDTFWSKTNPIWKIFACP